MWDMTDEQERELRKTVSRLNAVDGVRGREDDSSEWWWLVYVGIVLGLILMLTLASLIPGVYVLLLRVTGG